MQTLSFDQYLGSELRKITSTPVWWMIGLAMVLFSTIISALILVGTLNAPDANLTPDSPEALGAIYNIPAALALVFTLVLGVLTVTSEYQSGTISQTMLAGPKRSWTFGAKVLAAAIVSAGFAVVSLAAVVAVSAIILAGNNMAVMLTEPEVLTRLGGAGAVLVLWSVIGTGLGALLRNQLIAVVTVLLLTQAVEPILRVFAGDAGSFLPGTVADHASGGTLISMAMGQQPESQATSLALFAVYAVVILAAGAFSYRRYEVT